MKKYMALLMLSLLLCALFGFCLAEESTELYESTIELQDPTKADLYYQEGTLYLFNNITLSGNGTMLEEGGYTLISVPKDKFDRPSDYTGLSNSDIVLDSVVLSTETEYQLKIRLKTLHGGTSFSYPFKLYHNIHTAPNGSIVPIKQQLFDKDNRPLTKESVVNLTVHSELLGFGGCGERLWLNELQKTDDNTGVIAPIGIYRSGDQYSKIFDDVPFRVLLKLPPSVSLKENTGWTLEPTTQKYVKSFSTFETVKVETIVKNEFLPSNGQVVFPIAFEIETKNERSIKRECQFSIEYYPPTPPTTTPPSTYRPTPFESPRFYNDVGLRINGINGKESIYLALPSVIKHAEFITDAIFYKNYEPLEDRGGEGVKEIKVKKLTVELTKHQIPKKIEFLAEPKRIENYKNDLQNLHAYGVKSTGERILLTSRVPINSPLNSNPFEFSGGETFTKIEFEFPNDGLHLVGIPNLNSFENLGVTIYSDIANKAEFSAKLQQLVDDLNNSKQFNPNDYRITNTATTELKVKYKKFADSEPIEENRTLRDTDTIDLVPGANSIGAMLENVGGSYFTWEKFVANVYFYHGMGGLKNPIFYVLIPSGLEFLAEESKKSMPMIDFEKIKRVKGYVDDKDLLVLPLSTMGIDYRPEYQLHFKVSPFLEEGNYRISAALAIDNNFIGFDGNNEFNSVTGRDELEGEWTNLFKLGFNHPYKPNNFSKAEFIDFQVLPTKILVGSTKVKKESEATTAFSSSTGLATTIGDNITYRLLLRNNSPKKIDHVTLIDVLPFKGDSAIVPNDEGSYLPRGSAFKTPLLSVEENAKFNIFYSTDTPKQTAQENSIQATWHTSVDDMSKVTMLKMMLKEGQSLGVNEETAFILHNTIENDKTIPDGARAYHSFAYSSDFEHSFLETLSANVPVNYPKRDVMIEKTDEADPTLKLQGAYFNLHNAKTDELIESNIFTNAQGRYTIRQLLVGESYYLLETKAPQGYLLNPEKIPFTVEESSDDTPQKLSLTNTKIAKPIINISVTKVWEGREGESATIELYANDVKVQTKVLNTTTGWHHTFANLPTYDENGRHKLVYTVKEPSMQNYDTEIVGDEDTGFTITNTYKVTNIQSRDIKVTKKWIGPWQGAEGHRGLWVYLRGGDVFKSGFVAVDNGWTWVFKNVPIYDSRTKEKITYIVEEHPKFKPDEYKAELVGNAEEGFTLINTSVKKETIRAYVEWVGSVKDATILELHADDVKVAEQVVTADMNWQHNFGQHPIYNDKDGHKIQYKVVQKPIRNYRTKITEDSYSWYGRTFRVENINQENRDIKVTVKWIGPPFSTRISIWGIESDYHWFSPESPTHIFRNFQKYSEHKVTSNKDWEIQYYLSPSEKYNYDYNITGNMEEGFVVTYINKELFETKIIKRWVGEVGTSATVELYANGEKIDEQILTKETYWVGFFGRKLEGGSSQYYLYDQIDGHKINYEIKELPQDGYASSIEDYGSEIFITNVETVSISVTKSWLGKTGESATVELYANGSKQAEVVLNESNAWTHTFTNLPQYNLTTAQKIAYTVKEQPQEGYTTLIQGDETQGFTITNISNETVNIVVNKAWVGKTGEKAIVELYADDEKVAEQELNATQGWQHTFNALPKFNQTTGKPITYTVKEQPQDGYSVDIMGNDETGFTIVNIFESDIVTGLPKPKPVQVLLEATHTLDGIAYSSEDFAFVLKDEQGNTLQIQHGENGHITFTPLAFDAEGTHTFTLVAEKGKRTDVHYDPSVYTLLLTVQAQGDYVAELAIQKDGKAYEGVPHFASTTIKKHFPQTGDKANVTVQMLMALLSVVALGFMLKKCQKSKN